MSEQTMASKCSLDIRRRVERTHDTNPTVLAESSCDRRLVADNGTIYYLFSDASMLAYDNDEFRSRVIRTASERKAVAKIFQGNHE